MSTGDMASVEQTSLGRLELARLDVETGPVENLYEASLISRLREQDLSAFDEVVRNFEKQIYTVCFRMLGDAEDARDAAQETFLRVFRGMDTFRGDSGLKTWIYRIAINQAMNQQRWWRRRHRNQTVSLELSREDSELSLGQRLTSSSASPEQEAIDNEREGKVMRALAEIKPEFRAALILREIEELSYEEIATTLRTSIGTVKSRIARGRDELRKRMKGLL